MRVLKHGDQFPACYDASKFLGELSNAKNGVGGNDAINLFIWKAEKLAESGFDDVCIGYLWVSFGNGLHFSNELFVQPIIFLNFRHNQNNVIDKGSQCKYIGIHD